VPSNFLRRTNKCNSANASYLQDTESYSQLTEGTRCITNDSPRFESLLVENNLFVRKTISEIYLQLNVVYKVAVWSDSWRTAITRCVQYRSSSEGRIMRAQPMLLAAIPAILLSVTVQAEDKSKVDYSQQELEAKLGYCKTCHGLSGQGYRGAFPMPRLAGQRPEYLESQLQAFIDRKRTSSVMNNVAHVLSPSMVNALATHFRDLNPKPLGGPSGGAPSDLVAAGKKIYDEGIPQANVPACLVCHGKDAKGAKEFPRLAGQLNDYTMSKLQNWKAERMQDPAKPDNSHNLSDAQAKAVASYLSYLD